MRELHPLLKIFVLSVFVGGLGLLYFVSGDLAALDWQPRSLANLILWSVMIAIAAMSPIPLPRGGATVTGTSALDFAAILIFGPAVACWFGVLSDLLTNVAVKRNPLYKVAFNVGQIVLGGLDDFQAAVGPTINTVPMGEIKNQRGYGGKYNPGQKRLTRRQRVDRHGGRGRNSQKDRRLQSSDEQRIFLRPSAGLKNRNNFPPHPGDKPPRRL